MTPSLVPSFRLHGAVLATVLCATSACASDASPVPLADSVAAWAETQGPGAVVTAERRGGSWQFAFGGQPFAQPAPDVAPEHIAFEIGSISKVFTGLLLAHAVHDGTLALDDTLAEHLPVRFASAHTGTITLQQLATHTACLPRLPGDLANGVDPRDPYAHYDRERLFAALATLEPPQAPPCASEYSNFGFGVLGTVLELRYDMTWADLVRTRIAAPLGMQDTAQELDTARLSRVAQGWDGNTAMPPWTFRSMAGAGALRSTAADMARFADALLAGANGPLAPIWKYFATPHATGAGGQLGLGIVLRDDGTLLWHNGGTGGFRSDLRVRPSHGEATIVLASNAQADIDAWLAARAAAGTPPREKPSAIAMSVEALDEYVGVYALSPQAKFTVVRAGDGLRVRLTGQPFLSVIPHARDAFFYDAVDAQLRFERDGAGKIVALRLLQNGEQRAPRSNEPAPAIRFPDARALAEYAGEYDFSAFQPGASLTVVARGDVLTARLTQQQALPVHNTADDRFEWDVVDAALTFERDASGRIVAAVLHQNGAQMRSPRKPSP